MGGEFPDILPALFSGLIAVLIAYFLLKSSHKNLPPGPRGLKALWEVLQAMRQNSLVSQAEKWCRQYGKLVLCHSALGDICILNSADLVKELYASKELEQFTNNRPKSFTGWYVFYGFSGIIISDSSKRPEWHKMRKLFHHSIKFYGDGVDRMESAVKSELSRLVSVLEDSNEQDLDVDHIFSYSIMRIVIALLAGECPEQSLVAVASQWDQQTGELFSPITDFFLTVCPWLRFLPFLPFRKLCQDVIQSRDEMLDILFTKMKSTYNRHQHRGVVDLLLEEQAKEDNMWLTDNNIRAFIMDTIGAGHLTSTQTLKSVFLYLIHYPEVMHKIQEEIDEQLGQRSPRLQDRSNLPYVEAVVLETVRLITVISLSLPHLTTRDVTLDGYTIPSGTTTFYSAFAVQNYQAVYHDPEKFHPARFLDENGQLLPATHLLRQSMVPFGHGKRSCPGESFARSRIFLYIATLLQKFDILPPIEHKLLSTDQSSHKKGVVPQLKPYYAVFRRR